MDKAVVGMQKDGRSFVEAYEIFPVCNLVKYANA